VTFSRPPPSTVRRKLIMNFVKYMLNVSNYIRSGSIQTATTTKEDARMF
jgi:hypothetical protein